MNAQWRCATCGSVAPLVVAPRVKPEVLAALRDRIRRGSDPGEAVPLWCPWPLPTAWTVTGVGWVGDDRQPPQATALALSGPAPFSTNPADVVFVAEQLGVGVGAGLAGFGTVDVGQSLVDAVAGTPATVKIRVDGHPTPLWSVPAGPDRSVHVGEARAMWLYVIAWPVGAGYLLADGLRLHDLVESLPGELVYGSDSGRLRPVRAPPTGQPTTRPRRRTASDPPYGRHPIR